MQRSIQVLGHRGATDGGTVVENSLAAYQLADDRGADGVELDVRLGADGSLLLHHDPVISDGRAVADVTSHTRPAWMPTLGEALDVLVGRLVNIEIKNIPGEDAFDPSCVVADAVLDLLASRGGADDVLVSSFHPGTVDRVKAAAPQVATGLLSLFAPTAEESIALAVAGGHDAIHPHFAFVTDDLVAAAHGHGLAVNTWTPNESADLRRMAELGVDAVITDDVAMAIDVLRAG